MHVVVCDQRLLMRSLLVERLADYPHIASLAASSSFTTAIRLAQPAGVVLAAAHKRRALPPATKVVWYSESDSVADIADRVRQITMTTAGVGAGAPSLTPREGQVLDKLAEGLTSSDIAAELSLSPRTIDRHKSALYAKLEAQSQAHAVSRAFDLGLLPRAPG